MTEMMSKVRKQNQFSHCIVEHTGLFPHFPFALSWLQADASVTGIARYKPNLYGVVIMTVKPF